MRPTISLVREELARATQRLLPLDVLVLLRLVLRADAITHEVRGSPAEIAECLGLPEVMLPDILSRLRLRGLLEGDLVPGTHAIPIRILRLLMPNGDPPSELPYERSEYEVP